MPRNDPFKGRTNEDLAIQYALLTGPNPPTKLFGFTAVYYELIRRLGTTEADRTIREAQDIMKMVNG